MLFYFIMSACLFHYEYPGLLPQRLDYLEIWVDKLAAAGFYGISVMLICQSFQKVPHNAHIV
jgi:hypothetical protein